MSLAKLSAEDFADLFARTKTRYEEFASKGLKLDLTRGKPAFAQLDLSAELTSLPQPTIAADGTDVRNYGGLAGLADIRQIFAELFGVSLPQITAQGNSSLTLMRDTLAYFFLFGGPDSPRPWCQEEKVKFLAPVPGYDRHFNLTESFGVELIPVPMTSTGPDLEACMGLAAADPSIKGMWLVPTYSNPSGDTTTEAVTRGLMAMPTAAPDFTVFWDNAYALHHLSEVETPSANAINIAAEVDNPNRVIMFASTSKITFAGAGVAFMCANESLMNWWLGHLANGSIGPDKVNHLRHAQFFKNAEGVRSLMKQHRQILAPKFAAVETALTETLAGLGVATWSTPSGGYFVNFDVTPDTATRVVELAKNAGIALTPAGASYPGGVDPQDSNIRLSPSLPPLEEVQAAMEGVAICALYAACEAADR